jgi:hypothetical protein
VQLIPTNRPKPERRVGLLRTRHAAAIGRPSTDRQFEREQRRQDLLDRRWQRWRSMIFTLTISARNLIIPLAVSVGLLTGTIPIQRALEWLLSIV